MSIDAPRGSCVWLTGLSGAGKTTIATELAERLARRGRTVTLLDGDVVRTHLSKELGFSKADRDLNVRRVATVAADVVRQGGVAICPLVSPYEHARRAARELVGAASFVLVHVATPLAVCEARDVKGLYAKARRGELAGLTGVDDPYEPPAAPDLVLDTAETGAAECADRIIGLLTARETRS